MKKIAWILIALLLLSGCSKPVNTGLPEAEQTNPKGYMTEPKILISSAHEYKEESWLDGDVELKEDHIELQGSSLHISYIFEGEVSEEKLKSGIKIEGFEGTSETNYGMHEGKTVYYSSYRGIVPNRIYKLIISKDISDTEGKTLKTDIRKEITLRPDVTALYTLSGAMGVYKNLGRYATVDPYAVDSMNLTLDAKTIIVDFSADVDRSSVEQSIREGLKDKKVTLSLEWNNSKRLSLKLEGFKNEDDQPFAISMDSAKAINGDRIFGNLYFVVGKPNEIGAIDISSKAGSVIKKFADKRYMAIQSGFIGRTMLLDDTDSKMVYDMMSDSISRIDIDDAGTQFTKGIPGLSFVYSWLDSDRLMLVERNKGTVLSYSTLEGTSKEHFILPKEIVQNKIIEIAVSPDRSKLAVAYETWPPPGEMDKHDFVLHVFDMTGKTLYNKANQFVPRFLELFGSTLNMSWLNNDTLIMEDNISKENQLDYNVISININTGKKDIIVEHAFKPVLMPGGSMMKVESFKDFGGGQRTIEILRNGEKLRSFKAESFQYERFYFADENTLIYNEQESIFAYYIDKGKSELLGKGYIIGLSEDRNKVYYMTNQKMLYFID